MKFFEEEGGKTKAKTRAKPKAYIVRAHLPSKAILIKRFPEIFKNTRVGERNIKLISGYFINKLGHLSAKFYRKLKEECIEIPVEGKSLYVLPPHRAASFYAWVKEFRDEYVRLEEQLRGFITTGRIPEGVRKDAKFEKDYIATVQEYLAKEGENIRFNVPEIASRVSIAFEEWKPDDALFRVFEAEKYAELEEKVKLKENEIERKAREKEQRLLKELEREVREREREMVKEAYRRVEKKVQGVVREIERVLKSADKPTRRRIAYLISAIEAAENLANSIGADTSELRKAKVLIKEAEESLETQSKAKAKAEKKKKVRYASSKEALVASADRF